MYNSLEDHKRNKPDHPVLMLGNDEVLRKNEHKHLGIILDDKSNFQSHIKAAIAKARRGIGIINTYPGTSVEKCSIKSISFMSDLTLTMATSCIISTILK